MGLLHHWNDDETQSCEDLRDEYVKSVDNDPMASLAEIRNIHDDADYLTAEAFCKKYNIR